MVYVEGLWTLQYAGNNKTVKGETPSLSLIVVCHAKYLAWCLVSFWFSAGLIMFEFTIIR